jgi:uncharacterized protein YprB with RNaseH-like and TPR domain
MTLKGRLTRLQQQAGMEPPGSATPAHAPQLDNTIHRQLHRLSRAREGQRRAHARIDDKALARHLNGHCLRPGLIGLERSLPLGMAHGQSRLQQSAEEALELFGAEPGSAGHTLFLDCETTGLSGGSGTLVFLLGLAQLAPQGLRVQQFLLTRFQAETALLAEVSRALAGTQTLVTYNGKAFDRPLLANRYRMVRLADPLCSLTHVDLLHPTRRAFANRWPDCRLQTVETRLLGFFRPDDLPSACVPQAWFDWMREGATEQLPRALQHNRWDLLSLVALAPALQRCYEDPVANNACALSTLRQQRDEYRIYHYLLANRGQLAGKDLLELARLARRQNHWPLAVSIWKQLAARQHPEAIEHLAKYYEHRELDLPLALRFTQALTAVVPNISAHRHREQRLLQKLAAQAGQHEQGNSTETEHIATNSLISDLSDPS